MFDRLLIPTDYSDTSRRALDVGLRLAHTFGAQVVCLHVTELVAPSRFTSENIASVSDALDDDETHLRTAAADRLARLAERGVAVPSPDQVSYRVAGGTPHDEILALAQELRCDLIVIGTHGRSGLTDKVLGSTAERVMRKAQCSVFAVKPDGLPYLR